MELRPVLPPSHLPPTPRSLIASWWCWSHCQCSILTAHGEVPYGTHTTVVARTESCSLAASTTLALNTEPSFQVFSLNPGLCKENQNQIYSDSCKENILTGYAKKSVPGIRHLWFPLFCYAAKNWEVEKKLLHGSLPKRQDFFNTTSCPARTNPTKEGFNAFQHEAHSSTTKKNLRKIITKESLLSFHRFRKGNKKNMNLIIHQNKNNHMTETEIDRWEWNLKKKQ